MIIKQYDILVISEQMLTFQQTTVIINVEISTLWRLYMIDRFEKFSLTIFELSRYWHKLASEEMEKHGLKGPHAVYFTTMYRFPEGITAVKLAEVCSKDKADVSRAVSLLEQKGLITKTTATKNYRTPIKLTEMGEKIAEIINNKAKIAVENGGKGLSDNERGVFYSTLEKICSNLQELTVKGL